LGTGTLIFALIASHAGAQQPFEPPPPRLLPDQPAPLPVVPQPLPLPAPPLPPPGAPKLIPGPSPLLAKLAAESNAYAPCCEPPGPTRGLWCGQPPCAHCRSFQEWVMAYRDFLEWCYTRPTCCCGMRPASDASAWDWLTQWWPHANRAALGGTCARCDVITHGSSKPAVRD
jgi:hypothetical protein